MRAIGWGPPAVRNWSELVEHGIRLALAISVLINIPVTMIVGSNFLDLGDPRAAAGVGCMAAATVVVGVALIYWRWRALAAVITGALAILGLLLAGPETLRVPGLADAWWPTQFLIAIMAFLTLAHPVGYALSVLLIVANALVRWDISQASSDANGLSPSTEMLASTGQLLTLVAVPAIAGFLVRGAARDVDLATQWRITARAESERAASARRQIQEADRFVHDEVLFTLRAIAMGGQGVDPAAAQDAAAALLDRIAGSMPTNPRAPQVPRARCSARSSREHRSGSMSAVRSPSRSPGRSSMPCAWRRKRPCEMSTFMPGSTGRRSSPPCVASNSMSRSATGGWASRPR